MLVIRRRPGQSVLVGGDVEIEILEVCGNRVKLGIAAPKEVAVIRKELRVTCEANQTASRSLFGEALEAVAARLRRQNLAAPGKPAAPETGRGKPAGSLSRRFPADMSIGG